MWTRRAFLKSGGLALFTTGLGGSPLFLNRAVNAVGDLGLFKRRKVLVCLFQRGAMDGLMAVNPFEDKYLQQVRTRLRMSAAQSAGANGLIDLDGRFGLHPAFSPLHRLFTENRLAIVHGVGSPDATRSHFDAQDYMETATPGRKGTASGWLNRVVGIHGHEHLTPFSAIAMTPALPRSFYGSAPALAVADLNDFGLNPTGSAQSSVQTATSFEALYDQTAQQHLQGAGQDGFAAVEILAKLDVQNYRPAHGATYPNGLLGQNLRQIAQLIKADVGLEVAFAESNGWDTHVQQGAANGTFARLGQNLTEAIAAFWTDLGPYQDDVVLMTMTEFGRTVAENGSAGTDHGRASCMFILGNDIDGGKIHGNVPTLAPENLEDGRDLPVTTDFRAVFAEVAGQHLGVTQDAVIFPDWQGMRLPLFTQ